MDYTALGHTAGLAARMEQIAEPGKVYLTEHTAKLVEGLLQLQDLGKLTVKGVKEPLGVYELQGIGRLHSRIEVSRARGFSKFVGRERDMAVLDDALERALAGSAQVVGIVADPGVGKSRLSYEFVERLRARGIPIFAGHGVPHGKSIPFLPVLEVMRDYFAIKEGDSDETVRDKVAGRSLRLDRELDDALPFLYEFLGVPDPQHPAPQMEPEAKQRKIFAYLRRLTHAHSRREPAVFLLEDLHWFDGASEAFVENGIEALPGTRILMLVNFRPEYHAGWMQKSYYQQLPLLPLGPEAISELLQDLLGKDPSLAGLADRIRKRTGGNPFFIEESVQALAEGGSLIGARGAYRLVRPVAELTLPGTIQAVLAARIDRLGEREKHLLQTAAVIGKEFPEPVLRWVGELSASDLDASLAKLIGAEFIYERVLYPELEYTFKHALTQEVAYNSLLVERRQALHERTAEAIQALFGGPLEEHWSELAHHYSHSRNTEKAIEYSRLAGERAVKGSANVEAISHLTTALRLLETLPDTPERAQQELTLQVSLGAPLVAIKGFAAPEVGKAYTRARDLCRQIGEAPELFPVLSGLFASYLVRAEHRTALQLGEQLLSLAERARDSGLLVQAHFALGNASFWLGELATAREQLDFAIALYDAERHRSHAFVYGTDPGVASLSYAAGALWHLGYPDQALKRSDEALALARLVAHPFSLAWALSFAAWVRNLRKEWSLAEGRAEAMIALSTEQGFPFFLTLGTIFRGCAQAEQGRVEEGIAQMRHGLAAMPGLGAESLRPYALSQLAVACGTLGQRDDGLALVTEALAAVERSGERQWEAEVYRIKGELLLDSKGSSEAETCFRHAIDVSRRQSAKSLELRAVTSLSRLLQKQGNKEEARQILAEIYGWFSEGFDTADLKDARALLEELGG
jgi:predicted ATPase